MGAHAVRVMGVWHAAYQTQQLSVVLGCWLARAAAGEILDGGTNSRMQPAWAVDPADRKAA